MSPLLSGQGLKSKGTKTWYTD